ncbi:hypothetical protein OQI_01010 [Streptomyces pharetrae CZA14]|uniref:DUF3618 domain-containing protein n=1 Tax=Streptomyces pharetrae CZA14 TaxID=1144883 RepID=A0ABX3YRQ3_9ACTN|nr:hypothetical protein OQI_01010 [Streptomyces pharetrae CZA14]
MGTSPDQMRAEINATRDRLSADVDRLADYASPRRVVRRRTRRVRGAVSGVRERVMGTASDTAHGVRSGAQSAAGSLQEGTQQAAGQAGEAIRQAPDQAMRRTQGNPLAAGVIAFGFGMLVSSMLPATQAEQEKATDLMERGGEALEPVKQAALDSAQHLKEGAKEAAQSATQEVKDTAAEGARTTQDEARDQATRVTEQARGSGRQVADEARRQPGAGAP